MSIFSMKSMKQILNVQRVFNFQYIKFNIKNIKFHAIEWLNKKHVNNLTITTTRYNILNLHYVGELFHCTDFYFWTCCHGDWRQCKQHAKTRQYSTQFSLTLINHKTVTNEEWVTFTSWKTYGNGWGYLRDEPYFWFNL